MVNRVILVGNLCSDPDVRALADGRHVARLRLATRTVRGRDEEGNRKEGLSFTR
jgi:single-stranded DNA-binding protein